jgi:hypothetical protein
MRHLVVVPASGDLRQARARVREALRPRMPLLATPVLVGLGVADAALTSLGLGVSSGPRPRGQGRPDASARPTAALALVSRDDEPAARVDGRSAPAAARSAVLAGRGRQTLESMFARPYLAQLGFLLDAGIDRLTEQTEFAVDELNDLTEEVLGRIDLCAYGAMDKATSAATKFARATTAAFLTERRHPRAETHHETHWWSRSA